MTHGVVRWTQVARAIEADLPTYGFDEMLASESALSVEFDVSRATVRRAYGDLQRRGLVRVEPGVGRFRVLTGMLCPHCGGAL